MQSRIPDLCLKMIKKLKASLEPEGSVHAQVTGQEANLYPSPEVIWPSGFKGHLIQSGNTWIYNSFPWDNSHRQNRYTSIIAHFNFRERIPHNPTPGSYPSVRPSEALHWTEY